MIVLEKVLENIRHHVKNLEDVVLFLAENLSSPILYHSGQLHSGFRYMNPNIHNFCILKAIKALSGLNACIVLAEKGFNHEICVLIRTIVECTTQIEYVLAGYENGVLDEKQKSFIDAFFADFRRNGSDDFKRTKLKQEEVHKSISDFLQSGASHKSREEIKDMFYNIYQTYSNYVHGKYPEIMDLYGGDIPQFHVNGTYGTPKDKESIAIIANISNSVSISIAFIIQKSDMYERMMTIPKFDSWFQTQKKKTVV